MTLALVLSVLALALSLVSLWLAIQARGTSLGVQGALARHRQSHAERAEERRTTRHHPAPAGTPATEELSAVRAPDTAQRPASRPLPRPGQIGVPAPLDTPEDTW